MKKNTTKELLLQRAIDLFYESGYTKTPIRKITEKIDVKNTIIYYYFKSKEEIFEAVVKKEAYALSLELEKKVINVHDSPKDKIRNYTIIRMKYLKEMVNFYEALKNDYLGNLAFTERIRRKYDKEEQETIRNILEEGVNQSIFNIQNTKFAALAFVTFLKGLETTMIIDQELDMKSLEKNLDDILHILFYGMVK